MMSREDYRAEDALGLAALVRSGAVGPEELLDAALAEIDRLDPALNAVVIRDDARARADARAAPRDAPFAGVPFLAKDINLEVAGWPLTHACRFFAEAAPAAADSLLARRWRAAGLVVAGRSNTPEFATDFACEPELWGPTANPWDRARTPGGSSGGAAAAVAAGMVAMAHATDSGGSIRVPAACCGLFGFKPTSGLVATGSPLGPLVDGLNCDHAVTRSVRDSAALLDATAGPETGAPTAHARPEGSFLAAIARPPGRLRIGVVAASPAGLAPDPATAACLAETARLLEGLGHSVEAWSWPADVDPYDAATPFWAGEIAALVAERARALGREPRPDELGPLVRLSLDDARSRSALGMVEMRRRLWTIRTRMAAAMEGLDALLTPVMTEPPLPTGLLGGLAERDTDAWAARAFAFAPYTEIFNVTGQPAMSVPLGTGPEGMPIGMQIAGRVGEDATMLRLARQLEEAAPWAHRRPPPPDPAG